MRTGTIHLDLKIPGFKKGNQLMHKQIHPEAIENAHNQHEILKFFKYEHLPPKLQVISKQFYNMALNMAVQLPRCAETTVTLRKLLEAKDAAVRATL